MALAIVAGAILVARDNLLGSKARPGPLLQQDPVANDAAPAHSSAPPRAILKPAADSVEFTRSRESDEAAPNPLEPVIMGVLAGLAREPDEAARAETMANVARHLPIADLPAALAVVAHPDLVLSGGRMRAALLQTWGEQDLPGATRWVRRMSSGALREESIVILARSASRQLPPDQIPGWVRELNRESDRRVALPAVAQELAQVDPVGALALVAESPELVGQDDLIADIARQWAATNPGEALDWAAGVTAPNLQPRLLAGIIVTWADRDPAAAAAAAVQGIPPGRDQDDAVVSIVQRWTQQDPASAAAWVEDFPDGDLRVTAARELARLWAEQNLEQAGNWLNSVQPGALRDAAVAAYGEVLLPLAPDSAAAWVATIGNPVHRAEALEQASLLWLELDTDAARAWIATAALPPTLRHRLLAAGGD